MRYTYIRNPNKPLSLREVEIQLTEIVKTVKELPDIIVFPPEEYFLIRQLMDIRDYNKNLVCGIPMEVNPYLEYEGEAYI